MPREGCQSVIVVGLLVCGLVSQQFVAQDLLGTKSCLLDLLALDGSSWS